MGVFAERLLRELIKFKTVSLNYDKKIEDSHVLVDFLETQLKSLGLRVEIFEKRDDMPIIYASLDNGVNKTVSFITHYDVVPAGDGWNTDPFVPVKKEGKIYGRGASDDKGGIAAFIEAMKELLDKNDNMKINVKFLCFGDEEIGGLCGVKYMLEKHREIMACDVAYVLDASTSAVGIGCSTSLSGKVVVEGKGGHAAYPFKCKNAAEHAILLGKKLMEFGKIESKHVSKKLKAMPNPISEYIWNRLSVTVINSGEKPNVIPGSAEIKFNWRLIPEENVEMRKGELAEKFEEWKKELDIDAKLSFQDAHLGYAVDENNPFVLKLRKAVEKVCGCVPQACIELGATDGATIFHALKIPTISYGPIDDDCNFHGANEFIRTETLDRVKNVIKAFLIS